MDFAGIDFDYDQAEEQRKKQLQQQAREVQLRAHYAKTLKKVLSDQFTCPLFDTQPLYSVTTQDAAHVAAYKKLATQAARAIATLDFHQFKTCLRSSAIPLRIAHTQEILRLRWEWLQVNSKFIFFRRLRVISTVLQKKYFYNICLPVLLELNAAAPSTLLFLNTNLVFSELDTLEIDAYIKFVNSPMFKNIQSVTNTLENSPSFDKYKTAEHRRVDQTDARAIHKIFMEQIKLTSTKNYLTAQLQQELQNDLINQHVICTKHGANPQDSYAENLTAQYKMWLINLENDQYQEFMNWLQANLPTVSDLAELDVAIGAQVMAYNKPCNELMKNYEKVNAVVLAKEDELASANPLNISLEEPYFFVTDDEGRLSNPLLHLAMEKYAIHYDEAKNGILAFIELLIARGCSPYTKNIADGTRWQNAFEYAGIQPDWKVLTLVLKYMITRSPLALLVRQALIKECRYMLEPNYWDARNWDGNGAKIAFRKQVAELTEALYLSSQQFSDGELVIKVNAFCAHSNSKVGEALKKALTELLDRTQRDILFIPAEMSKLCVIDKEPAIELQEIKATSSGVFPFHQKSAATRVKSSTDTAPQSTLGLKV